MQVDMGKADKNIPNPFSTGGGGTRFEWLVGTEVGETLQRMKRVPPVPEGLRYFKELDLKGYRLVVMSYSPGIFVESWLQAHELSA